MKAEDIIQNFWLAALILIGGAGIFFAIVQVIKALP